MAPIVSSNSSAAIPLTCSLTGQPTLDPVITPSGHICDRALLLAKLNDNNHTDPFSSQSTALPPETLISVKTSHPGVLPPLSSSTSLPLLLHKTQNEVNALLLELYDTRKALEETRRELSLALYQNDAAVRVIARMSAERDAAKEKLAEVLSSRHRGGGGVVEEEEEEPAKKRKRDGDAVAPSDETPPPNSRIPDKDVEIMVAQWKTLSKQRRQTKIPPPSLDVLSSLSLQHTVPTSHAVIDTGIALTAAATGGDTTIHYLSSQGVPHHTITLPDTASSVTCMASLGDRIAVGCTDGTLRLLSSSNGEELSRVTISSSPPCGLKRVAVQPSGRYLVGLTARGASFLSVTDTAGLEVRHRWEAEEGVTFETMGLHPDGLIMALGRSDGTVAIWDLKTQSLASTLEMPGNDHPVTAVAFSENGYHFASVHTDSLSVWDLRKLKLLKNMSGGGTPLGGVSFDPSGKYIAYGVTQDESHKEGDARSAAAAVKVIAIKDWDRCVTTLRHTDATGEKGQITDLAWVGSTNGDTTDTLGVVVMSQTKTDDTAPAVGVVTFWSAPSLSATAAVKKETETKGDADEDEAIKVQAAADGDSDVKVKKEETPEKMTE